MLLDMCDSKCVNYNVVQDSCELIERDDLSELEALMNASHEKLAEFLLSNNCVGDFRAMYSKSQMGR
ncbi:conserved hypothetical protein [Vibrio aestuarianus]|nr:conserved hypothetical protein [Vibrio aestuarianus]CAH8186045.1 conserved hypothetical protein [Vibrio aestuarianus]CAH8236013.1 conserved hypothetical protein [Vibrio aestuarianus]CAH8236508.1 conserved hypothetical protein [Vibrio aestuarianus]CAH8241245.1 conserved hypothetical protein [Vibrio aestuarianus]